MPRQYIIYSVYYIRYEPYDMYYTLCSMELIFATDRPYTYYIKNILKHSVNFLGAKNHCMDVKNFPNRT